jgi:hypothetical protein
MSLIVTDRISSSYTQKEPFSEAELQRLQRTHLTSRKRPKIFWRGTPTQLWGHADVHGGKRIAFDKYVSHLKNRDRDSADSILDEWWDEMGRETPNLLLAYARWRRCPVDGSKDDESSDQAGSSKGYEPGLFTLFGKLDQFRRGFLWENVYKICSISQSNSVYFCIRQSDCSTYSGNSNEHRWSPGLHSSKDHVHSPEEIEESGKDDSYHDVRSEFSRSKRHHDSNFKHDADVSANPPRPEWEAAAAAASSSLSWRPGFVDSLSPEDASHPGHRKSSHELWMKLQSIERGAIQKERKFSAEDKEPANISTADSMPDTGTNRINTEDSSSEIINPSRVSLALIRFSETLSATETESDAAQANTRESNTSTNSTEECDSAERVLLGGSTGGGTSEKCVLPSGDDFVAVKTDVEVDVQVSAHSLPEQFSPPKEPDAHQGSEASATAQQTPLATTPLTTLPSLMSEWKPFAHLAASDADVVNKLYSDFGLVSPTDACQRTDGGGTHMRSSSSSSESSARGGVKTVKLNETPSDTPLNTISSNSNTISDAPVPPTTSNTPQSMNTMSDAPVSPTTSNSTSADLRVGSTGRSHDYRHEHRHFINETSFEAVHRNARVQLVHLSNKYPHLINARFVQNVTGLIDARGEVTEEGRGYARKTSKPVGLEDQIR